MFIWYELSWAIEGFSRIHCWCEPCRLVNVYLCMDHVDQIWTGSMKCAGCHCHVEHGAGGSDATNLDSELWETTRSSSSFAAHSSLCARMSPPATDISIPHADCTHLSLDCSVIYLQKLSLFIFFYIDLIISSSTLSLLLHSRVSWVNLLYALCHKMWDECW